MSHDEYFSVHYDLTINVEPLAVDTPLPNMETFEREIPAPFRVAQECSALDDVSESELSFLKQDDGKRLANYLNNQNQKLNLLLSYLLIQQDEAMYRHKTLTFGASRFTYETDTALTIGQMTKVKLFLEHPPSAIYCYATVTQCTETENGFIIEMAYQLLRDIDQDLLIKAALFQQQKVLKLRAQERNLT
ncbi:PilZ domain-containing protein [Aliivibrio fischeri]|uniref:PilZ domain-containing protein n=1 Tax=Aliivibrio fischeri TaxID=668 RepID=UPI0012DA3819|nr:PilZ domain-containing protein [Aliivibrio fischeri]MUJ39541.1 PilZ domain-containing protein [Aliivibrio fischeri]